MNAAAQPENIINLPQSENNAPNSQESEENTLGSILIHPPTYHKVNQIIKADDFYLVRNRLIYEAMSRAVVDGKTADFVTVTEELRKHKQLDLIGGSSYLGYLTTHSATWVYAATYAELIKRTAMRRRIIELGLKLISMGKTEETAIVDSLPIAVKELNELVREGTDETLTAMPDAVSDYMAWMEKPDLIPLVKTHIKSLDEVLGGGFAPGELVYLMGRPSMGKTSLLATFAGNMASSVPFGYWSFEATTIDIITKIHAGMTRFKVNDIKNKKLLTDYEAMQKLYKALEVLGLDKRCVISQTRLDVDTLGSTLQALSVRGGDNDLKVAIIDYLDLFTRPKGMEKDAYAATTYISQRLKQIALDCNICIICAVQMSRAAEGRADKAPQLSDLRNSGSLEQDADVVLGLYREAYYNKDLDQSRPHLVQIEVLKNRNRGGLGTATALFDPACSLFANLPIVTTPSQPTKIDFS